jgi:hypothetical protein
MRTFVLSAVVLTLLFVFIACGPGAPANPDSTGAETQSGSAALTEEQMKALYFEWTKISLDLAAGATSAEDIHQKADEALRSFRTRHSLSQQQFLEVMQMGQEKNWALEYIQQ